MGISQLENRDWIFKNNVTIEKDFTIEGDFTFGDATTDAMTVVGVLGLSDGTALLPSLAFTSDLTTGMYLIGADHIGMTINAKEFADFNLAGTTMTVRNDTAIGNTLVLKQSSLTPAANDQPGMIQFVGQDDVAPPGASDVIYSLVTGVIMDPATGAEFGAVDIMAQNGTGVITQTGRFSHDGTGGRLSIGDGVSAGQVWSSGSQDLQLVTGNVTTGRLTLAHGADGDLTFEPNANGGFVINSAPNEGQIITVNDNGDKGGALSFFHDSDTPAISDTVGKINGAGKNSVDADTLYGSIGFGILNPTNGTETGGMGFKMIKSGAMPTNPQFSINGGSGAIGVIRESDGAEGAAVTLTQVSASPAEDDEIGYIKFIGKNDAAGTVEYAQLTTVIDTPANGTETGEVYIKTMAAGTIRQAAGFGYGSSGQWMETGFIENTVNNGTVFADATVDADEYGDGFNHTTVIKLTDYIIGPLAGAGAALVLIPPQALLVFPAGAHILSVTWAELDVTATGPAVTPDIGLGSVAGDGSAFAALADATIGITVEDIMTGFAVADTDTATDVENGPITPTAGALAGIALNKVGDSKNLFLNAAATWNADNTGNLTASGKIVIKWSTMNAA